MDYKHRLDSVGYCHPEPPSSLLYTTSFGRSGRPWMRALSFKIGKAPAGIYVPRFGCSSVAFGELWGLKALQASTGPDQLHPKALLLVRQCIFTFSHPMADLGGSTPTCNLLRRVLKTEAELCRPGFNCHRLFCRHCIPH